MKIHTLFLVFGQEHVESGLRIASELLQRTFPGAEISTLVIDNSRVGNGYTREDGIEVISGDNSCFDFTGWQKGFEYIFQRGGVGSGDLLFFINDTFHRHVGLKYLDFFNKEIIADKDPNSIVVGFLDDFPRPAKLMGIEYSSWIRSNLFLMPFDLALNIRNFVYPQSAAEVFSNNLERFWSDTPHISENFKAYISCWLFNKLDPRFPEYKLNWKASQVLTHNNLEDFRRKALCILSEHYLTCRIVRSGFEIVDLNKFEKRLDRHTTPYYEQEAQRE